MGRKRKKLFKSLCKYLLFGIAYGIFAYLVVMILASVVVAPMSGFAFSLKDFLKRLIQFWLLGLMLIIISTLYYFIIDKFKKFQVY